MKRAHQLYADAVSALLKLVAEQMDMSATDEQRLDCIGKMTDTFSLVRNALFSFSEQISQLQNQQLIGRYLAKMVQLIYPQLLEEEV